MATRTETYPFLIGKRPGRSRTALYRVVRDRIGFYASGAFGIRFPHVLEPVRERFIVAINEHRITAFGACRLAFPTRLLKVSPCFGARTVVARPTE